MTVVNLSTVGPALGHPENVPIDGAATAVAWVGDAPYSYLDGAEVVMPAPLVVRLDDGVPSEPFDIPPDNGVHCWRIEVETWNPGHSIVRYVTVPDSPTPVDFEDLADVNRYSFDPEAEPEAAWWTAVNPFITAYNAGELKGDAGAPGAPGAPGPSAYDVAVANGFVGTEAEWLASLEGTDGEDGADSTVPGPEGPSAYDVAVANGFVGTEAEWLASLQGEPGEPGEGGGAAHDPVGLGQTIPRAAAVATTAFGGSGNMLIGYLTAEADGIATSAFAAVAATTSAAVTASKICLYSVDPGTGDIALIAETASFTADWGTANNALLKAFTTPVAVTAGTRYAVGVWMTTSGASPSVRGASAAGLIIGAAGVPRLGAFVTGQASPPTSLTAAQLAASTPSGVPYFAILP